MRSFCVLTPEARDDAFCDGVFEDGLRILHEDHLTSVLFSRVLSPAHDLTRVVVAPLIAALQERRPSVLVVGLPGAEKPPRSRASASSASAQPPRETTRRIASCCQVAMSLYEPLLSLVFQNLPDCTGATCSVITASANDRWLYDGVQGKRVRALEEVEWVTIDRNAPRADGLATLLACLAQRHEGLQGEVDSLSSETACVVTLQLEPYAPLVLVDVGSDQDVLQQLTLILGMWGACGRRTYPPRSSPLVSLLQEYVVPEAALHVVVVPEPASSLRHTMRLVRFASGLEAHRQESLVLASSAATPRSGAASPPRRPPTTATAAAGASAARGAATLETSHGTHSGIRAVRQRAATAALSANTSSFSRHTPVAEPTRESEGPIYHRPTHVQSAAVLATAPAPPPPTAAAATTAATVAVADEEPVRPLSPPNDHLLTLRIHTLETALEDVKNAYTREHSTRVRLETQVTSLRTEADERQARLTTEAQEAAKLRADNADFSALVPRLLKKVSALEKAKAAWETQRTALTHDRDVAQQRVAELQTLITRLKKGIAQKEHQRALTARERTLHGMLDHVAQIAEHNSRLEEETSHRGRTGKRALSRRPQDPHQARGRIIARTPSAASSADEDEDDKDEERGGPLPSEGRVLSRAQRERLHAITVDELRRRNTSLEKELATWRRHGAAPSATATPLDPREPLQTSTAPANVAESAPFLRERLEYFMSELSHARQEKDSLIRYILAHRDDPAQASSLPLSDLHDRSAHDHHHRREDTDGHIHSYQETAPPPAHQAAEVRRGGDHPSWSHSASVKDDDEGPQSVRVATPPTAAETCPICAVLAALQAGCAALLSVHDGLLAAVEADPDGTRASGLTAHAVQEHARATHALRQAVSETAQRPVYGIQHGPHTAARPFPLVANMANSATLSEVLSFESERAARLASFVPSFTQLAVATDNLLMRVPRTSTGGDGERLRA